MAQQPPAAKAPNWSSSGAPEARSSAEVFELFANLHGAPTELRRSSSGAPVEWARREKFGKGGEQKLGKKELYFAKNDKTRYSNQCSTQLISKPHLFD